MIKLVNNAVEAVTDEDIARISGKLQASPEYIDPERSVTIDLSSEMILYYVVAELAQERCEKRQVSSVLTGAKAFHGKLGEMIAQFEESPSMETAERLFDENSDIVREILHGIGETGEADKEAEQNDRQIIKVCKAEVSLFLESNEEVVQKKEENEGCGCISVAIVSGWKAIVNQKNHQGIGEILGELLSGTPFEGVVQVIRG